MGEIINSQKGVKSGVPERVSISCPHYIISRTFIGSNVHGSLANNHNAGMPSQKYIWKTCNNSTQLRSASWIAVQPQRLVLVVIAVWVSCLICIDTYIPSAIGCRTISLMISE